MKDCIEYINKYNHLKKMIRISDQNFKMNLKIIPLYDVSN